MVPRFAKHDLSRKRLHPFLCRLLKPAPAAFRQMGLPRIMEAIPLVLADRFTTAARTAYRDSATRKARRSKKAAGYVAWIGTGSFAQDEQEQQKGLCAP